MTRALVLLMMLLTLTGAVYVDGPDPDFMHGVLFALPFGAGLALQNRDAAIGFRGFGLILMFAGAAALILATPNG